MCGIIAYIGDKQVIPILTQGLQRLEYRGYDSAGIAFPEEGELKVIKTFGAVDRLLSIVEREEHQASYGIGHTRWATHGVPSDYNAHPHLDCKNSIAVVHNGIVENYRELKEELNKSGHVFTSDTDSEVIAHLFEEHYDGDLEKAVLKAIPRLHGAYAIATVSAKEKKIILIRKQSPLIIGLGKDEYYSASDIPAILPFTKDIVILEDGEVGIITSNDFRVLKPDGTEKIPLITSVEWDITLAERGGYPHYMLKEISEQPTILKDTLRERLILGKLYLEEAELGNMIQGLNKIYFGACGTAYHASLIGKNYFETLAGIEADSEVASEFRYRDIAWVNPGVGIIISQSGETADTLAALYRLKEKGYHTLGITNVVGSSVAREVDRVIYTRAGPEISVASTKAYTSQILGLFMIALLWARKRNYLNERKEEYYIRELEDLPYKAQQLLDDSKVFMDLGKSLKDSQKIFFIGRLTDYKVAMEGALKMKEISYIHAEAYAAGELKHGPLALIEDGTPVIALLTNPTIAPKLLSNLEEIKSRRGKVILLTTIDIKPGEGIEVLKIPSTDQLLSPVISGIALQLLAYYTARECGASIDKPRNLAKSVTVE